MLRTLLAGWLLALVARVALFREGGEIGAYACSVVFWACTLGLVILSMSKILNRQKGETLPFVLILTAVLAFIYPILVSRGPTTSIASWVFIVCVVGLLVTYSRRRWAQL